MGPPNWWCSARSVALRESSPETTGGRARHGGRLGAGLERPSGPITPPSAAFPPRPGRRSRAVHSHFFLKKILDLPLLLRVRVRKIVTFGHRCINEIPKLWHPDIEGSSEGSHDPVPRRVRGVINPCQGIPELVAFGRRPVAGAERTDPAGGRPELISGQRDRGWGLPHLIIEVCHIVPRSAPPGGGPTIPLTPWGSPRILRFRRDGRERGPMPAGPGIIRHDPSVL